MKNARIHLIYLAIIGFLTYQYWTKTQALDEAVGSIEQFDKLLKMNNEVVAKSSTMIKYAIDKQVHTYLNNTNKSYLEKAQNLISASSMMANWLEKQRTELINLAGGEDKKDSIHLAAHFNKRVSRFYSGANIQEIRDSLIHFQVALNNVADSYRLKEFQKQFSTLSLTKNETYWQTFRNKSVSDALTQFTAIQNRIELDKIAFLNHIFNYTGSNEHHEDSFKVAIVPRKIDLIEGEEFKADVYLASYSRNLGNNITFWANNHEIKIEDGVAHFESTDLSIGKKVVNVEARIRNPLTGQTTTANAELEYEVFPKCSRDCK
jgi:hypothetical protein